MAIPAGISTALVHLDAPVSFAGDAGRIHARIVPSIPLVWAATGTPIGNFIDNIAMDPGVEMRLSLPHVDQPGFLDGSGSTVTGWSYRIEVTYEKDGQTIPFPARDFQILVGQVEVDLALIPSGDAHVPVVAPILTVTSVGGFTGVVTKAELGINNVNNTSDAEKPLSNAAITALGLKAPLVSPAFTGTPTGITKSHVGLSQVDNTSDANKPVSAAQSTAIGLKQDKGSLDADVAAKASAPGTDLHAALSAAFVSQYGGEYDKSKPALNALYEFNGIKLVDKTTAPSSWVDSTDAIQAAIIEAESSGSELLLPAASPGQGYLVNGGLRISKPIKFTGSGNYEMKAANGATRKRQSGTVLFATETGDGSPVLNISPSDSHMYGFTLQNVSINGWNGAARTNRVGLNVERIHAEFIMEALRITGFAQQGINLSEVYDGVLSNTLVFTCGTDGTHAALDIAGANGNNSNAIHSYGLHIESSPFALRVTGSSRHIQFTDSKIEMYSEAPVNAPIQFINCQEITMTNPQLVYRNTNDRYFYATDDQPPMILASGAKVDLAITSPMASTPPYFQESTRGHDGARWYKATNDARVRVIGGTFNTTWGGGGEPGIQLGDRGILLGNRIVSRVTNSERSIIGVGKQCIVDSNQFEGVTPTDETLPVAAGSVITATGTENTIGASNKFRISANKYIEGPSPQFVKEMERRLVALPKDTSVLTVGWRERGNTKLFSLGNTVATDITGLTGGLTNDEITIQFTSGLNRLVHGATFKLLNGASVTPAAEKIMTFRYDGVTWFETNRNF